MPRTAAKQDIRAAELFAMVFGFLLSVLIVVGICLRQAGAQRRESARLVQRARARRRQWKATLQQEPFVVYVNLDKQMAYPIDWSNHKAAPTLEPPERTPADQVHPQSTHPQLPGQLPNTTVDTAAQSAVQAHQDSTTHAVESSVDCTAPSSADASSALHRNVPASTVVELSAIPAAAASSVHPPQHSTADGTVQTTVQHVQPSTLAVVATGQHACGATGTHSDCPAAEGYSTLRSVAADTVDGSEGSGGHAAGPGYTMQGVAGGNEAEAAEQVHSMGSREQHLSGELLQGDRDVEAAQEWFAALPASAVPCIGVMPDAALCICLRCNSSEDLLAEYSSLQTSTVVQSQDRDTVVAGRNARQGTVDDDRFNRTLRTPEEVHAFMATFGFFVPTQVPAPADASNQNVPVAEGSVLADESSSPAVAGPAPSDTDGATQENDVCAAGLNTVVQGQPSHTAHGFNQIHAAASHESAKDATEDPVVVHPLASGAVQVDSAVADNISTVHVQGESEHREKIRNSSTSSGSAGRPRAINESDERVECASTEYREAASCSAVNYIEPVDEVPHGGEEQVVRDDDGAVVSGNEALPGGIGNVVLDEEEVLYSNAERNRGVGQDASGSGDALGEAQGREGEEDVRYFYKKELRQSDFEHVHQEVLVAAWGSFGVPDSGS